MIGKFSGSVPLWWFPTWGIKTIHCTSRIWLLSTGVTPYTYPAIWVRKSTIVINFPRIFLEERMSNHLLKYLLRIHIYVLYECIKLWYLLKRFFFVLSRCCKHNLISLYITCFCHCCCHLILLSNLCFNLSNLLTLQRRWGNFHTQDYIVNLTLSQTWNIYIILFTIIC